MPTSKNNQAWKPCEEITRRGCKFVYIPHESVSANSSDSNFEELKSFVEGSLPESYKIVSELRDEIVVVGHNGYYDVCLARVDWATVLVVVVRDDAPAIAKGRLSYVANAIFKKVAEHYKVMVSSGHRFVVRK
mgnify:FL=1